MRVIYTKIEPKDGIWDALTISASDDGEFFESKIRQLIDDGYTSIILEKNGIKEFYVVDNERCL